MALCDRHRLTNARGRPLRLDAGQHFLCPPELAVGRHQQPTQADVSAAQVVKLDPGSEAAVGFGQIEEALLIEDLLLDVRIEGLELTIGFGGLGDNLVDLQLCQ